MRMGLFSCFRGNAGARGWLFPSACRVVEYPRYTPVFCFVALDVFLLSTLLLGNNLLNGERATVKVAS